mmetsp:Transcript_9539/g.15873  ORF Transcript_9539/g.15873 Transcript_9539/m.15873 type:complete len:552 (+) Transcript_9539:68-1723(+)
MSSSRRGSASFVPKPLPYKIHHSQVDAGKMIASSKKVVVWRFGYPDDKKVHDVTLKHSVTGGKKVILENGKEIVKIGHQAVVTDFAHGWESDGHIMRVAVSTKNEYSFSVDGVEYEDFPTEAGSNAIAHELAAKAKKDHHDHHHPKPKRLSSGKKTDRAPVERRHSASFDPFASGDTTGAATGTSSFYEEPDSFSSGFDSTDPFASPTKTDTTDPFSAGFDSHITTNTSQDKPRPGLARQFTSPREEFESHSPPPTQTSSGFNSADLFADNSPPSQQKQQPQQQQAASFDFFADQSAPSNSQPHHNVPNVKPPPANSARPHHHPHSHPHPQPQVNDFFADSSPPAPPQQQQQQPPQQQQSTGAYDFSGMTYDMPTMEHNPFNQAIHESFTSPQQEQPQQQQQQQQTQAQPQQSSLNDNKTSGSLFGLVNLDLSSGNPPQPQRNKSIYESAGDNTHRSSANTTSAPTSSSVNPFDSFAMNSGPPVNHGQSQYQQPTTNSNWMASGNIGMMTDQSSFMNSTYQQQPQYGSGGKPQQGGAGGGKTSLDTLDWKM